MLTLLIIPNVSHDSNIFHHQAGIKPSQSNTIRFYIEGEAVSVQTWDRNRGKDTKTRETLSVQERDVAIGSAFRYEAIGYRRFIGFFRKRDMEGKKISKKAGKHNKKKSIQFADSVDFSTKSVALKIVGKGLVANLGFLLPYCKYSVDIDTKDIWKAFPNSTTLTVSTAT
ncbi:hypothetical protein AAMO2058_000634100 [Amorphochlora amoebiformis]